MFGGRPGVSTPVVPGNGGISDTTDIGVSQYRDLDKMG